MRRLLTSRRNPDPDESRDSSETAVLERLAPAVTWWPRWFRKHLTPNMVVGAVIIVFTAGGLWANYRTANDLKDAQRAVRELKTEVNAKLAEISGRSSKVDVLEQKQDDLTGRIERMEENYDTAAREAGAPLNLRRGRVAPKR